MPTEIYLFLIKMFLFVSISMLMKIVCTSMLMKIVCTSMLMKITGGCFLHQGCPGREIEVRSLVFFLSFCLLFKKLLYAFRCFAYVYQPVLLEGRRWCWIPSGTGVPNSIDYLAGEVEARVTSARNCCWSFSPALVQSQQQASLPVSQYLLFFFLFKFFAPTSPHPTPAQYLLFKQWLETCFLPQNI